ncbi:hypothetical protein MIND_00163300 [Mycena indigotica]|uniref:Uncharacterized protein n=1 Tax=Mycena indigotica TaxID=2126181 RepID=A0A8H6WIS9_9AGAR|nr:uncharacterized protein MIND_00163300 [Mycena indigotica]KAF7316443.1 hypothetical protein MIND_00163300 [Mycena indigotica]
MTFPRVCLSTASGQLVLLPGTTSPLPNSDFSLELACGAIGAALVLSAITTTSLFPSHNSCVAASKHHQGKFLQPASASSKLAVWICPFFVGARLRRHAVLDFSGRKTCSDPSLSAFNNLGVTRSRGSSPAPCNAIGPTYAITTVNSFPSTTTFFARARLRRHWSSILPTSNSPSLTPTSRYHFPSPEQRFSLELACSAVLPKPRLAHNTLQSSPLDPPFFSGSSPAAPLQPISPRVAHNLCRQHGRRKTCASVWLPAALNANLDPAGPKLCHQHTEQKRRATL